MLVPIVVLVISAQFGGTEDADLRQQPGKTATARDADPVQLALANQPVADIEKQNEQLAAKHLMLNHLIFRDRGKQNRLRQATAAIDSGNLIYGFDLLQSILERGDDSFVWVNGGTKLASVRSEVFRILSSLPRNALRTYERKIGTTAKRALNDARRLGSPVLFAEVARKYYHTSAGLAAVDWQATRCLDQGRFVMASRIWDRVLAEPVHKPRISSRQVLKAALAHWLSGKHERAAAILEQRNLQEVRIAGRLVSPRSWLAGLPSSGPMSTPESDWRLVLGDARRNAKSHGSAPFLRPEWTIPLAGKGQELAAVRDWERNAVNDPLRSIAVANFPLAVGNQIIARDFQGIRSFDLESGQPLWHFKSALPLAKLIATTSAAQPVSRGTLSAFDRAYVANTAMGMLASDGKRLFAIEFREKKSGPGVAAIANSTTSGILPIANQLVTLEIDDGGSARQSVRRPIWTSSEVDGVVTDAERLDQHYFLGPPLPVDGMLFAITEFDLQLILVALNATTGELLWAQRIALAERPVRDNSQSHRQVAACSPSFAEGVVVCPTGVGILVGVDAMTGVLRWAYHYGDETQPLSHRGRPYRNRKTYGNAAYPTLPRIHNGRVVYLPRQSANVHCIDLLTGRELWKVPRGDAEFVAAVNDHTVMLVGRAYARGLTIQNGQEQWSKRVGLPSGSGIRIGENYLVPLKSGRVANIEMATGREIGFTVAHPLVTSDGKPRMGSSGLKSSVDDHAERDFFMRPGNLLAHRDVIVSLGPQHLTVFPQAAALLKRVRGKLQTEPSSTDRLLQAAELELTLGELDKADQHLRQSLAAQPTVDSVAKTEELIRELRYIQLDSRASDPSGLLDQLDHLARTPEQRGRFLIHKTEWQLKTKDFSGVLRSTREFAALELKSFLPMSDEPNLLVSTESWVPSMMNRVQTQFDDAQLARVHAQIDEELRAAQQANDDAALRSFLTTYAGWPQARSVRLQLARRLIALGKFQAAELLLLQNRNNADPHTAAVATTELALLWNRLGLDHETAMLLRELNGRFADVPLNAGQTGRTFVAQFPRDGLAWSVFKLGDAPRWPVSHVGIHERRWSESDPDLQKTFVTYRRRFLTPDSSAFHLIDKGTASESEIAVVDKSSGVVVGRIKIPSRNFFPAWARKSLIGHFVPIGSPANMHGVSLLEFENSQPLWTQTFAPVSQQKEYMRVGPAGPSFCTFQTRQHLVAVHPAAGRVLWRRSDLEPTSGLLVDPTAGLFGDENVLVLFSGNRSSYSVYQTTTGRELRRGDLDIDIGYQRRVFGRKLFYVSKSTTDRRLRIWDPLSNRFEMDEPFSGLLYSAVTPENELAVILPSRELRILDVQTNQVRLAMPLEPSDMAGLNYIRVFGDHNNYYVNLQRPRRRNGRVTSSYYASDTFLPASHVQGDLYAVSRTTGQLLWKRTMPQRSILRLRQYDLPFLIGMSRVRNTANRNRYSMMIEIIDAQSGNTLARKTNIFPDRIVQISYDAKQGRITLLGLKSRIDLNFGRGLQQIPSGDPTL